MPGKLGAEKGGKPASKAVTRILHILIAEKFMEPYIEFVETNFDDFEEHIFFCMGSVSQHPLNRRKNLRLKSDYRRKIWAYLDLVRLMYKVEKIILHGLWVPLSFLLLSLQPWLLRKCYWVMWGWDLYAYKLKNQSSRRRIHEILRRIVIKRVGHLVTYVDGDVELAREWYGARGHYHRCLMYPSNLFRNCDVPRKLDDTINIQVGNSADPSNEHLEVLSVLEQFKHENIRVYAPLSYGDQVYACNVADVGRRVFGDKFIALTEFSPADEYLRFLGSIDIAIFNHRRQQAMGNIIKLLGLGKKVYLHPKTTSRAVFESLGIKVFGLNYLSLDRLDEKTATRNSECIRSAFTEDVLRRQWQEILG